MKNRALVEGPKLLVRVARLQRELKKLLKRRSLRQRLANPVKGTLMCLSRLRSRSQEKARRLLPGGIYPPKIGSGLPLISVQHKMVTTSGRLWKMLSFSIKACKERGM